MEPQKKNSVQREASSFCQVTHLADADWPDVDADVVDDDKVVFFDVLGLFMVTLSNGQWHALNWLLVALACRQTASWVASNHLGTSLKSNKTWKFSFRLELWT